MGWDQAVQVLIGQADFLLILKNNSQMFLIFIFSMFRGNFSLSLFPQEVASSICPLSPISLRWSEMKLNEKDRLMLVSSISVSRSIH